MPFSHEFEEDVLEPQTATTHEEFGDRARVEKQPVIHHDSVRARLLNLTEQMGGHDHRPARRGVVVHDLAHFANLGWVKTVGGLVKNEEIRHAEHRLGDAETLAHALAVGADLAVDGAAWVDALGQQVVWNDMAIGVSYAVVTFAVLVGIAVLRFDRKDVLS